MKIYLLFHDTCYDSCHFKLTRVILVVKFILNICDRDGKRRISRGDQEIQDRVLTDSRSISEGASAPAGVQVSPSTAHVMTLTAAAARAS